MVRMVTLTKEVRDVRLLTGILTIAFLVLGRLFSNGKCLFLIAGHDARSSQRAQRLAGRYVGLIMEGAALAVATVWLFPQLSDAFFWGVVAVFVIFMIVVMVLLNRCLAELP